MLAQSKNRVQAIKSKFENLNVDNEPLIARKKAVEKQLCKQTNSKESDDLSQKSNENNVDDKENASGNCDTAYGEGEKSAESESDTSTDSFTPKPNSSYLHTKSEVKRSISDTKKSLSRQSSDPGKKLHRSHAFRCDKSQKISPGPKRHGSCYGRSENGEFTLKMSEKKLSKDKLKRLGNLLEDQMRKEGFVPLDASETKETPESKSHISIPDSEVPPHILEQYAKVLKKKNESTDKQDLTTDSGVSSETENLEEEKNRFKKIKANSELDIAHGNVEHIVKPLHSNLENVKDELCASTETMRLERRNPHLKLTDTLKKALKQPLPPGPPPKKPPRIFAGPETFEKKKDTKQMLEKLEQVLQKREAQSKNIYDIAETDLSEPERPKEVHYLCTEILDITQRTLLPNQANNDLLGTCFRGFNSLNCAIVNNRSMSSLPYTRLSTGSISNSNNLNLCCSCSSNSLDVDRPRLSTFFKEGTENLCDKCKLNGKKVDRFKCHLNCKCTEHKSEFFVSKNDDHIYDLPFGGNKNKMADEKGTDECVRVRGILRKSESNNNNSYGVVKSCTLDRIQSRSMENLKLKTEEEKIYDIPCETSRPATPDVTTTALTDFEKLRLNFETKNNSTHHTLKTSDVPTKPSTEKPVPKPKPIISNLVPVPMDPKLKVSKSSENLSNDFKKAKDCLEKKFATETKRFKKNEAQNKATGNNYTLNLKKEKRDQLDMDKENLNRLMNEIYDTVSAACEMAERNRFPTSHSDSDDSVKLTRSLTEKRKNYVRRVSSKVAYLDSKTARKRFRNQTSVCSVKSEILNNPYSTFRSWKSFRNSQNNLNMTDVSFDKMAELRRDSTDSKFNLTDSSGNLMSNDLDSSLDLSLDDKAGCLDLDLPFEPRVRGLFDICLLVGLNYMTGQAYVKSVFPDQVKVPPHIENLVFPETISTEFESKFNYELAASKTQCYSLVLTDEKGERNYGYCRRVLPEGASCCLPLCYCIIGRYRAPGFYYKVLKEIESHHGSSEVEINTILQQLFDSDLPNPAEEITLKYEAKIHQELLKSHDANKSKTLPVKKTENIRLSGNTTESRESRYRVPDFYDIENNNRPKTVILSLGTERVKTIKRPIEPRVDEHSYSILLDTLGTGLLIKVFGSLLLERKVVLISDNLSQLSSCIEGLQLILYPFVWQQPLISIIPSELRREILEAPLPILAGLLRSGGDGLPNLEGVMFEEGMLIDISVQPAKVYFYQGDELTILPTLLYKSLKTTLQMESSKNHTEKTEKNLTDNDEKTRSVLISEAFLRFFVDILGDFWQFFSVGFKEGWMGSGDVVFDKETFIKSASSKQNQYYLEWFCETAIFNHFIQNMAACYHAKTENKVFDYSSIDGIVDAPLPNYYELFDERLNRINKKNTIKTQDNATKSNYKSALNKKVKLLKCKLRDLVT